MVIPSIRMLPLTSSYDRPSSCLGGMFDALSPLVVVLAWVRPAPFMNQALCRLQDHLTAGGYQAMLCHHLLPQSWMCSVVSRAEKPLALALVPLGRESERPVLLPFVGKPQSLPSVDGQPRLHHSGVSQLGKRNAGQGGSDKPVPTQVTAVFIPPSKGWRLSSDALYLPLCRRPLMTIRPPPPTAIADVQCGEPRREALGSRAGTAGS
ncbi:hypothetical protein EDB85DRAFT_2158677 [Lactarius pseudohatsudake]|nr:hypothetical protein EDB85DRAFT_2158677 [Lactarius pseudohatsudake]